MPSGSVARNVAAAAGILAALAGLALPAANTWACATPANLVTNCGFDSGFLGWTGGWTLDSGQGQPPPSALGTAGPLEPGPMYAAGLGQCIGVSPSTTYGFGARAQFVSGGAFSCSVSVFWYANATCDATGFQGSAASANFVPAPSWTLGTASFTTAPTSASVKLQLICMDTVVFSLRADDFFLGQGLTPVELEALTIE